MAYTTIDKPTDYFNTITYSGNASTQSITGVGFQPDLNWTKGRNVGTFHMLTDAVRGATKVLQSNTTTAEQTFASGLTSFNSDGFTAGNSDDINGNYNYASWNWKAGTTSGITQGGASITPSSYSINATAGFSIIKWQGTNTNATIPHGLGATPKMIIIRRLESTSDWVVYHSSVGNTSRLVLNSTGASSANSTFFNNTSPTSTTFSVGSDGGSNGSTDNYIAYCFAEKQGYSKFGSYVGNGNADGTFVYTGFKPAFVIQKRTDGTGNWHMFDNKRDVDNVVEKRLWSNLGSAEPSSLATLDFISNGFKWRDNTSGWNGSGTSNIYMAFAENPFVGSNFVPNNAR